MANLELSIFPLSTLLNCATVLPANACIGSKASIWHNPPRSQRRECLCEHASRPDPCARSHSRLILKGGYPFFSRG
jgi:hypothetical protein